MRHHRAEICKLYNIKKSVFNIGRFNRMKKDIQYRIRRSKNNIYCILII